MAAEAGAPPSPPSYPISLSRWSSATTDVYFDILFRLENVIFKIRQDILDTRILIWYRKLYINILSIIVSNIEARQYHIKINLAISCSGVVSL